jgi:hypothetical protein
MLVLDDLSPDDPGRAFAILRSGDDSGGNLPEHSHGAEIKYLGGLGQRDLATFGPLGLPIDCDTVHIAEATHARLRPPVQAACSLSFSVQHASDRLIGHQARASTDQFNDFGFDAPTCLAPSVFLHRETGMIAALPVQQQLDLLTLDARNYLAQHDTDDTLAGDDGGCGMTPGNLQVSP